MTVEIRAASAERFDDAQRAFTGGGDGAACQCQWWTLTNAEFHATDRPERERMLRDQLAASVAPALVAYVDGEAAGWVRVGPRTTQPRLSRTRDLAEATPPWDDPDVWAVSCFVVRKEHRGAGLMRRLLDAAIAHAREHGARVVEGYPFDPSVRGRSVNDLYRGVASVFAQAGFREIARPRPDRAIVALDLEN